MPIETLASSKPVMTLDEARKTLWLRNNCRPLGELLDEGYLNQTRLKWAAEKAYDSKLREAAKVILEWLSRSPKSAWAPPEQPRTSTNISESAFEPGISLAEARSTMWPFAPYKNQPMGQLVEAKQISLKDLGYSIENAWDEHVKRASIALLLARLKQTVKEQPQSAGFMNVVSSGRSWAERWQLALFFLEGAFLGVLIGISFTTSFFTSRQTPQKPLSEILAKPSGVVAFIIAIVLATGLLALLLAFVLYVMKRFERSIENHRIGQEGEDRTVEIIRQSLDGNWTLFRNVVLPGRYRGDLDAILVSRSGVWVLEIKTLNGEYRNIGDKWEYKRGRQWKTAKKNPSLQANDNAIRVANFLKSDNIKQWVTGVVIWAGNIPPEIENPLVNVWTTDRLADELGNLSSNHPMQESQREAIIGKLTKLCEREGK